MRRGVGPKQPAVPVGQQPVTVGVAIRPRAQDLGDAIRTWHCSGSSYFAQDAQPLIAAQQWPVTPTSAPYGEIVAAYYVPPGQIAWVHDVEIAPYLGTGLATTETDGLVIANPYEPNGIASYGWHYQTGPGAWKGLPAIVAQGQPAVTAEWSWAILAAPGNIYTRRVPPPAPNTPVPLATLLRVGFRSVYAGQLPTGDVYSEVPLVGAARGAEGAWNVTITEDSTVALVVKGRNPLLDTNAWNPARAQVNSLAFAGSFGRLRGYQQPTSTEAARRHASGGLGS